MDTTGGAAVAKIYVVGEGVLEVDHLTLVTSNPADPLPFIGAQNTTLRVHDNTFVGYDGGDQNGNCTVDAVVIGGMDEPTMENEGFGSVVRDNAFVNIRRGVFYRNMCHGVQFYGNMFSANCGNVGGAAIESSGSIVNGVNTGGLIANNNIWSGFYTYGVQLAASENFHIMGNNLFTRGSMTNSVYFGADAQKNVLIDGLVGNLVPYDALLANVYISSTPGPTQDVQLPSGSAVLQLSFVSGILKSITTL
jgi:hypothetical protein